MGKAARPLRARTYLVLRASTPTVVAAQRAEAREHLIYPASALDAQKSISASELS
jgi:hypothetical protein